MYPQLETQLELWDNLELLLFPKYNELGIPSDQQPYYTAWAKRKAEVCVHLAETTRDQEWSLLDDEFETRGLTPSWLTELTPLIEEWCGDVRGDPHPSACWFNRCEDLSEWTIDAQITKEIDTANKKEWLSSIKLTRNTIVSGNAFFYPTTQNICATIFGFWVKPNLITNSSVWLRKYKTSTGEYQAAILGYDVGSGKIAVFHQGQVSGTNLSSPFFYYDVGSWLWIELGQSGNNLYMRVNGVTKSTLVFGAPFSGWDKVQGYIMSASTLGVMNLDYWRLASSYEYPPT